MPCSHAIDHLIEKRTSGRHASRGEEEAAQWRGAVAASTRHGHLFQRLQRLAPADATCLCLLLAHFAHIVGSLGVEIGRLPRVAVGRHRLLPACTRLSSVPPRVGSHPRPCGGCCPLRSRLHTRSLSPLCRTLSFRQAGRREGGREQGERGGVGEGTSKPPSPLSSAARRNHSRALPAISLALVDPARHLTSSTPQPRPASSSPSASSASSASSPSSPPTPLLVVARRGRFLATPLSAHCPPPPACLGTRSTLQAGPCILAPRARTV